MFILKINQEVYLKLLEQRDSQHLYKTIESNKDYLKKSIPWVNTIKSVNDVVLYIKQGIDQFRDETGFQAGIWYLDELVGIIGIDRINKVNQSTSLGCWLSPKYQGIGIMLQSAIRIINLLFDRYSLNRLEVRTASENNKSILLIKKLGFKQEGVLREAELINGIFHDHLIFSLLKKDWYESKSEMSTVGF